MTVGPVSRSCKLRSCEHEWRFTQRLVWNSRVFRDSALITPANRAQIANFIQFPMLLCLGCHHIVLNSEMWVFPICVCVCVCAEQMWQEGPMESTACWWLCWWGCSVQLVTGTGGCCCPYPWAQWRGGSPRDLFQMHRGVVFIASAFLHISHSTL